LPSTMMYSNVLMIHPADVAGNVPAGAVGIKWGEDGNRAYARVPTPSLPATNAKRLRKGAQATKQSSPSPEASGLLRLRSQ
jgi:hypothetical protein